MHQKTQTNVSGPAGEIELDMVLPDQPNNIAVLCHPHPLYGGTMHDSVLQVAAETLLQRNVGVVRFNFRGVEQAKALAENPLPMKNRRGLMRRRKLATCWRSFAG